jgi:tryptophan-rich sensory protein
MLKGKIFKLIYALALCQAVGWLGSNFTVKSLDTWYAALNKPVFNPPNWIFAPVWIGLYLLMGISLYLVLSKEPRDSAVKSALWVFGVQLVLNAVWTPLFFGARLLLVAFIEILVLWIFIVLTIVKFKPISRIAAYLLIPYLLWVSFASVLNGALWLLNR